MLKAITLLLTLGLTLIPAIAQTPPPNDDFANPTVLSGTNLTFTGTLAGATVESDEPAGQYLQISNSIWWSWTAPTTTVLNLKFLGPISSGYAGGNYAEIAVYSNNGNATLSGLSSNLLGAADFNSDLFPAVLSIPVTAGSNYLIRLASDDENETNFQLALIADNNPLILKQPVSRTVSSNDCVLFYVIASHTKPLGNTYQWLFNGTNLPGETAPMLSLTNVDGTMAGNYSVTVSNGSNFTLSQPATLTVSQSNVPILLEVTGIISNSLAFNLVGESGRYYDIQYSTDLNDWQDSFNSYLPSFFPFSFQQPYYRTSLIQSTNASMPLQVTKTGTAMFFRALPYIPSDEHSAICINNLNQIYIAKVLWMIENEEPVTSWPAAFNLQPYFPHQVLPACPDDVVATLPTSYNLGNLQTSPTCLIIPTKHHLSLVP